MKYLVYCSFLLIVVLYACTLEDTPPPLEEEENAGLSEFDKEVIVYFKEIALGFEFGNANEITRKWANPMRIYVGGTLSAELAEELDEIIDEIGMLATDGFSLELVADSAQSNYYLFLGSAAEYSALFPSAADQVESNWGLFTLWWNGNNQHYRGRMYVDIERADLQAQKHLLREELTQSLGLAQDSRRYRNSIFQQEWTVVTEYAEIDRELIRLLYHPEMRTGLNENTVDIVLENILTEN